MENKINAYEYSSGAQKTWQCFYGEIKNTWQKYSGIIHPYYMENTHVLSEFSDHIPSINEINEILNSIGWTAEYVNGYTEPWIIYNLLSKNILPVSHKIRPDNEVFFATEPDLIHDIFGHLPILLNSRYRQLLSLWSAAAIKQAVTEVDKASYHLNKVIVQAQNRVSDIDLNKLKLSLKYLREYKDKFPTPLQFLGQTYFWTFEFGIIVCDTQKKIIGAGLLSSLSEIEKFAKEHVNLEPLTLTNVMNDYNISTEQSGYLVVSSFEAFECIIVKAIEQCHVPKLLI